MTRLAALLLLLLLLVACNSGPLQWTDTENWTAGDSWRSCQPDTANDFASFDACNALSVELVESNSDRVGTRVVARNAITVGLGRCTATLRSDDSAAPASCSVEFTTGDDIRTPRRTYSTTLSVIGVDVARESWRIRTTSMWSVRGTVTRNGTQENIASTAFFSTILTPAP
jgi:hypothetical protein